MSKRRPPIKYVDRDFDSIKKSLVEHAKRYYPNTYRDFNQASFGSLLLDSVSYVGDVLSFYLDYQANESFLDSAIEIDNVISLARLYGYNYSDSISSYGMCDFFITVPVSALTSGPDLRYAPVLREGSELSSTNGGRFFLIEDVDFTDPNNLTVVSNVDPTNGAPTEFAIKSSGQIKSGFIDEAFFEIGEFKRFPKIKVELENITEILSVEDQEGHRYYEVGHLSQDVIYQSIVNRSKETINRKGKPPIRKVEVKNILKPLATSRRFVASHFPGYAEIQFGQASDSEILSGSFEDPTNVVMRQFGKQHVSDTYLDPTKFTTSDKMGIAPSNTTLSVRVIRNESEFANAPAGSVTTVTNKIVNFEDESGLETEKLNKAKRSIECFNEDPILGDLSTPNEEEIRLRTKSLYATQNRAVTNQDYVSMLYSMPGKFGSIKRARIENDKDSLKRNLNIYLISEDSEGNFIKTNLPTKNNIKNWLINYRMMSDTFDIMDAHIVNVGIDYEIVVDQGFNKLETIIECNREIEEHFSTKSEIGESLYLNDIYNVLNNLESVVDVTSVKVRNLSGGEYSQVSYDIDLNLSLDERVLLIPSDHVYEMKFPAIDIRGTTT